MRRVIAVYNLFGDAWHREARLSVMDYAARCGAALLEVRQPPGGGGAYETKLSLDLAIPVEWQPCRVLYLDRDLVIRSDCPDLFGIVPEGHFGAVPSEQEGHNLRHHLDPKMERWTAATGLPALDMDTEYLNSGLLLFDLPAHGVIFSLAREKLAAHRGDAHGWEVVDQGVISSCRKASGVPLLALPPCFNRCGAACWGRYDGTISDFVYHFCSTGNNPDKINAARWRVEEDCRDGEGFRRWQAGKPLGLLQHTSLEAETLWRLWSQVPPGGQILEVGTWLGSSLWGAVMATHQRGVTVWAVDSWEGSTDFPGGASEQAARWRAFLQNMADSGLERFTRIVKLRSAEAAALFDDASLDLVFIDGDHSEAAVRADISAWLPKVKSGGVLCGHDYGDHFPGLTRAVDELFGTRAAVSPGSYRVWSVRVSG